ncbi:unnamed protein product [Ostreobium quekettii]|uniref:Uncharacterized protein n=1 Tax=Ostreobium quekettii TaxID=121088 RepID=A0A8S1IZG4_9CHLO|nr:unnamed protein product [Ostreobium quekettii]
MAAGASPAAWRWPAPADVRPDQLPLRLEGARWEDAEQFQASHPSASVLKYVEDRGGDLYVVERPSAVHEGVAFSLSRELTKWAVRNSVPPQLTLLPSYNLEGVWPRRVGGRLHEADCGWASRRALKAAPDPGATGLHLVLEAAVGQSLEAAEAKVRRVWFAADDYGPSLAVVVKVDVCGSGHGVRALLLSRHSEAPLVDVTLGAAAGGEGEGPSLVLPLELLYGDHAGELAPGTPAPRIAVRAISKPAFACLEGEGG